MGSLSIEWQLYQNNNEIIKAFVYIYILKEYKEEEVNKVYKY